MKTGIIIIIALLLAAMAFMLGQGCSDDSDTQRQLDESREEIERLDAEKDSLKQIQKALSDSLDIAVARVDKANTDRKRAESETRQAIAELKNIPTYETLSDDELAVRADSVYIAGAVSETDTG